MAARIPTHLLQTYLLLCRMEQEEHAGHANRALTAMEEIWPNIHAAARASINTLYDQTTYQDPSDARP